MRFFRHIWPWRGFDGANCWFFNGEVSWKMRDFFLSDPQKMRRLWAVSVIGPNSCLFINGRSLWSYCRPLGPPVPAFSAATDSIEFHRAIVKGTFTDVVRLFFHYFLFYGYFFLTAFIWGGRPNVCWYSGK